MSNNPTIESNYNNITYLWIAYTVTSIIFVTLIILMSLNIKLLRNNQRDANKIIQEYINLKESSLDSQLKINQSTIQYIQDHIEIHQYLHKKIEKVISE